MPRPGFYNDNEYRAYPFVYRSDYIGPALSNAAVVDCGIIMGLDSEFAHAQHAVWLASVTREAGVLRFELATDAPNAAALPLVFECPENGAEWTTSFAATAPAASAPCALEPVWEGFLVTGPLDDLLAQLADNGNALTFPIKERALEPGRVQSLVKSYVRSINLGNLPRVRALPPSNCQEEGDPADPRAIVVNAQCLRGNLRLKEGYNCSIKQATPFNELRISAQLRAGDTDFAELCAHGGELPLYAGEPFDEETGFFSGGPACNQVISTLNGIGGGSVNIIGGTGITVTTNTETNTVVIALAQNNLVGTCGN